jgi:hypothetical protein
MATWVSWPVEEMIISLFMQILRSRRPEAEATTAGGGRRGRREGEQHEDHPSSHKRQLVKRRILTFRMSPKPASVAIAAEPP